MSRPPRICPLRRAAGSRCLWLTLVLGFTPLAQGETAHGVMEFRGFQQRLAEVFSPGAFAGPDSGFATTCEAVLLMSQAIAATVIIGAMLMRMRDDDAQMESTASLILKVAFIATVPTWQVLVLNTADTMAEAVGYRASGDGAAAPVLTGAWALLENWMPPGSPYLDALQSQSAGDLPASGDEEAWGLRAWNWARGVGAATDDHFQWLWQTFSGGLRAFVVFVGCSMAMCALAVSIVVVHLGEVIRHLIFQLGCAFTPIFIAGLGSDLLRARSARCLFGVAAVAFWPVGWAVIDIPSAAMLTATHAWINDVVAAAVQQSAAAKGVPVAIAAPYLGWGVLLLFGSVTLALSLWVVGSVLLVPVLFSRWFSFGDHVLHAGRMESAGRERVAVQIPQPFAAQPATASEPAGIRPGITLPAGDWHTRNAPAVRWSTPHPMPYATRQFPAPPSRTRRSSPPTAQSEA